MSYVFFWPPSAPGAYSKSNHRESGLDTARPYRLFQPWVKSSEIYFILLPIRSYHVFPDMHLNVYSAEALEMDSEI